MILSLYDSLRENALPLGAYCIVNSMFRLIISKIYTSRTNRKKKLCFEGTVIESVLGDFVGLVRKSSVCFGCFDTGAKHRNKPKSFCGGFEKQTEKQPKQNEFRFV
jgi:hypothetical protein